MRRMSITALAGLAILAAVNPAFANEDWVQPAVGLAEVLESGLVKIGAVVIGIAIIALGLWTCASQRMEWSRMGYVVLGGLLVMTGPTALRALLNMAS